jgi:hypothetical protein
LAILFVQLLAACNANSNALVETLTPVLSPSPAPTESPTGTETAAITEVQTSSPSPDSIETASIDAVVATVQPVTLETYPSSDGNWQAEVVRYDCINYSAADYAARIAYEQLKLINLTAGTEQIIEDQLQNCDGIGGGGLKGLLWSTNNRFFYYTDWREGNPESCGNYVVPMVYRFDTSTQENLTVGGGHLSPDQTKFAMWQRTEIVIWDLDQGEVERVGPLTRVRFNGEISWSPDSQSIVFLQTEWDCAPDYGKTYLSRLDLSNTSQEILFEHESPGFGSVRWETVDQVTLLDGMRNTWTYNLSTEELKAIP